MEAYIMEGYIMEAYIMEAYITEGYITEEGFIMEHSVMGVQKPLILKHLVPHACHLFSDSPSV